MADELRVEGADFAVEYQHASRQLGHCAGDVREASGVVAAVSADETYAVAVLVREHPPAVVLLLEDPAVTVKRLAYECRVHRLDGRNIGAGHQPASLASLSTDTERPW